MLRIRESFGAKLLTGLLFTVGLLLTVTFTVVRSETARQVELVFGAPVAQRDDALRAVHAALRMKQAMAELNVGRTERGDAPIGLGIGLSTGIVVAGNMGSKSRLNYTVLGEIVNLGARLCAGAAPGQVLISDSTRTEAGPSVEVESRGAQAFKGFSSSVEVYEVVGVRSSRGYGSGRGGAGDGLEVALATKTGVLRTLVFGSSLALASATAPPLVAQDWPTLSDAGIAYLSSDGGVQLDVSGQLDLEVLTFTGHDAGLAYGGGTFVAPRIRLFTDVFLGDRIYGLLEVRSDRGEAPTVDVWEGRVEQVFVRVSNLAGTFAMQAGRFASPFASYAGRHLTEIDPFIRPPLAYDYRTIMSCTKAPPNADRFLEWRDDPATFRHVGAPPVWGVPYQWGAMLSGRIGNIQYRAAAMNSAPSSEVEAWGWSADGLRDPSIVLGASTSLSAELSFGASYNRGPYAELGVGQYDQTVYIQEMVSLDATFARGPVMARVEVIHDRWVVPNVSEDAVEWGYGAEAQVDLATGFSLAVRFGYLDFRSVSDGLGTASSRPGGKSDWDYDLARYEIGLGYRLARNAGLLGTFMHNEQLAVDDPDDDLLAFRLWWAF